METIIENKKDNPLVIDNSDIIDKSKPVSVDSLIDQLDDVTNSTARIRNIVIAKLAKAIDTQDIDFNSDDIDSVTMKTQTYDLLLKALEQKEKSHINRINTRLKKQDSESSTEFGKLATELLTKITSNTVTASSDAIFSDELSKLQKATNGIEVTENECKADPLDFGKEKPEEV